MSAYARSSVTFQQNGIQRFSQRRSSRPNSGNDQSQGSKERRTGSLGGTNGRVSSGSRSNGVGKNNNLNSMNVANNHGSNAPSNHFSPIEHPQNGNFELQDKGGEHSAPIANEYPFSQITMSQPSLGENSFHSRTSQLENRAARWRSGRKEMEERSTRFNSASKMVRMEDKSTPPVRNWNRSKATAAANSTGNVLSQKLYAMQTPRRDKRTRLTSVLSSNRKSSMPPPRPVPMNSNPRFSSSLVARGASAVVSAAMTPLRSWRLGQNRLLSSRQALAQQQQQEYSRSYPSFSQQEASPLQRKKKSRRGVEEEESKTSQSTYDPNPPGGEKGRAGVKSRVMSNEEQDECAESNAAIAKFETTNNSSEKNGKSKKSATKEKFENATRNKKDDATQLIQSDEIQFKLSQMKTILSQIQSSKLEMDKAHTEQRETLESKRKEIIHHRELFDQEYTRANKDLERQREEIGVERLGLESLKSNIGEMHSSIEKMHCEIQSVSTRQSDIVADLEKVQKESMQEMKRFVDEAKTRLQVCGKLEVEALENESRVVKQELREIVNVATREMEEKKKMALGNGGTAEIGPIANLGKENSKPSDGITIRSKPLKDNSESLFKTAKSPDTSMTAEESNDSDNNSFDDDESLLNYSSLAPLPPKRAPGKSVASVYSTHTAPQPGASMSTSTAPFSKKATPRIQNSYTKNKGLNAKPALASSMPPNDDGARSSGNKMSSISNCEQLDNTQKVSPADATGRKVVKPSPIPVRSSKKAAPTAQAPKSKSVPKINSTKKRSRSDTKTLDISSPRRSKRIRESARIEQKQALEASLSQDSIVSRQVTPKEDVSPPLKSIGKTKSNGKTPSPMVSFKYTSSNDKSTSIDSKDMLLGKSVLVNANQDQDIGLDGCESIVQKDVGPLAVPWGARNGAAKSRKKSYANGRKRDRKLFSFETVSSIFDFKF